VTQSRWGRKSRPNFRLLPRVKLQNYGRNGRNVFKTTNIILFNPMMCKSPCKCALTRRADANTNQPIEKRPTFTTCNSSLAHITCTTKLINTAARVVIAHLDFCTSWGQTKWFCCFKGVTYMSPLHSVIKWWVFLNWKRMIKKERTAVEHKTSRLSTGRLVIIATERKWETRKKTKQTNKRNMNMISIVNI